MNHARRILPLVGLLLTSCSEQDIKEVIGVMIGLVLLIIVASMCAFTYYTALLAGAAISGLKNLQNPTKKSRAWGVALGVANLVNAGLGGWVIYTVATDPDPDAGSERAWVYLAIGAVLSLLAGAGSIGAAIAGRARPESTE